MNNQLYKKVFIEGRIELLTGLTIGGTNNAMNIGGLSTEIIRNPLNDQPYIPGSSLKGKMRSLLELHYGSIIKKDLTKDIIFLGSDDRDENITARLFGSTHKEPHKQRPSRIIVYDSDLGNEEELASVAMYTEIKTEVIIDRITSKAMPRTLERVPAGAVFNFKLVLNLFKEEEKEEKELLKNIFMSLQLVQDDYIGGNGTRGSGRVNFCLDTVYEKDFEFYQDTSSKREDKIEDYKNLGLIPDELYCIPK